MRAWTEYLTAKSLAKEDGEAKGSESKGEGEGKGKGSAGVYLCVLRKCEGVPLCGVGTSPFPETDDEVATSKAGAGSGWSRGVNGVTLPHGDVHGPLSTAASARGLALWGRRCALDFAAARTPADDTVEHAAPMDPTVLDDALSDFPCIGMSRPSQMLLDACLIVDGQDSIPDGFEDSGVLLPSAVDPTRNLRLCLHFAGVSTNGTLPFEGVWQLDDGVVEVREPFPLVNGTVAAVVVVSS